ncbi:MAG: EamA family transporter [Candidatus Eisenbacteria bacterium]|nr:EamA family transporter [Candidatus Eisenbacteria bacterium]
MAGDPAGRPCARPGEESVAALPGGGDRGRVEAVVPEGGSMPYLIIAIACSSSLALIFKYTETRGLNRYAVTSANYLVAALVGSILVLSSGTSVPGPGRWPDLVPGLAAALGRTGSLSPDEGALWALGTGIAAGGVFFVSFILYQISIRRHGAGLPGAFIKLGIFLPMTLSLILWREHPRTMQWLGMGCAGASIVAANWPGRHRIGRGLRPVLLALFLFGGLAEFSNKVFQKYGLVEQKPVFLWATFSTAFVVSLLAALKARRPVQRRDLALGVAVGVPNLFSSFFLIMALDHMPAAVVFPAFGAGSVLVINTVGVLLLGERLAYRDRIAVGLTILGLILINV